MSALRLRAPRDGALGELLAGLVPEAQAALREGRVFVGRRRATDPSWRVRAGDEVVVHSARAGDADDVVRLLDRRDGVVAAYKPAAVASIPDHRGARGSLLDEAERLSGARPLHATSRLDVGVSGVVLLAADDAARARLAASREQGAYLRRYVAVASRAPSPPEGVWDAPIGRAADPRLRQVGGREPKPAATRYRVVAEAAGGAALLAVEPATGRTHQIRVHAAHAGCALFGDAAYGGPTRAVDATGAVTRLARIGLHAAWVEVPAADGSRWLVEAAPPADFEAVARAAGFDAASVARALARW